MTYFEGEGKKALIQRIHRLYETDLGDFKRQVALCLNTFSQSRAWPAPARQKIRDLKQLVLLQEADTSKEPMENIDHLRQILLEELEKL